MIYEIAHLFKQSLNKNLSGKKSTNKYIENTQVIFIICVTK